MKSKILNFSLVAVMALSSVACTGPETTTGTSSNEEVSSQATTTDEASAGTSSEEATSEESSVTDETTEAEETDATTEESTTAESKAPIETVEPSSSEAEIKGETQTAFKTSLEAPGKVGEWQEAMRLSTVDNQMHPIYFRITKVVLDKTEMEAKIEKFNETAEEIINPLADDFINYGYLEYEVFFPEDFPTSEAGIEQYGLNFKVTDFDGEIIQHEGVTYAGVQDTRDITASPEALPQAGSVVKAESLFKMFDTTDEFNIVVNYFAEGENHKAVTRVTR